MPVSDVTQEQGSTRRPGAGWTEFGELLRHHRRRAGLTQSQLGVRVGYHHSLISKWESGLRELPAPLVAHLDAVLATGGELAAMEGRLRPRAAPDRAGLQQRSLGAGLFGLLPGIHHPHRAAAPHELAPHWPLSLTTDGTQCPLHGRTDCLVPGFDDLPKLLDGLEQPGAAADDEDLFHALTALVDCCAHLVSHTLSTSVLGTGEQVLRTLVSWARSVNSAGRPPYAQLRLAAHYAQTVGRLRLLRGQNGIAMAWFGHGLRWAEASGDLAVRATLLTDASTLARLEDDALSAVGYAQELAAVDARQGWMQFLSHLYQARGYAMAGDLAGWRRHDALARRRFDALGDADLAEAPWLAGAAGALHLESALAAAGRDIAALTGDRATADRATVTAELALGLVPPGMLPVELLLTVRLADARLCTGDVDAALATVEPVVERTAGARRLTLSKELRGLHAHLRTHWGGAREVREFEDRLRV